MVGHMARSLLPTAVVAGSLLGLRALEDGPRGPWLAAGELAAYATLTALATLAFERPLLREALSYVTRRPAGA
jgi:hypothetical protein